MRRVLLGCALVLGMVIAPLAPVGARPRADDRAAERAILADRDGDRLDDVLEARLRRSAAGSRHAVVVATDGSVSVAASRRAIGAFPVSLRLGIIDGFAARLTAGQARALARLPGVLRIDHDAEVRATMDAARADYGVDGARQAYGLTGAGVTVCILDTGADGTHEQLDSKTITWRDFIGTSTTPYDDHSHGTHVASIAVGDGQGGASAQRYGGVAPDAALWAGKVLDAQGSGNESGIIAGIDWCAGSAEVDIISMSLGSVFPSDGSDNLSLAANRAVTTGGKVVTAAAGNGGDAPDTIAAPGAAPDVITVGASSAWSASAGSPNQTNGIFLAYFSGRGGAATAQKPDIVAPGFNINAANANTGAGYVVHSGTSMATPFAAGSAALALQAAPGWSPLQLQGAMESTAEDFGPAGKDRDWGAGLIDVLALAASANGAAAATTFPTHVHLSGTVPNGGDWNHTFQIDAADLGVPIAATVILGGQCRLYFPGFGCLDAEWSPDLDAALFDPSGAQLALSQCMTGSACGFGRQETLHAMPTVAGTYRIRVYAYLGSPNNGLGGPFDLDLSTGPVGTPAPPPPPPPPSPPPTIHVSDLDRASATVNPTTWRAEVTIRVHDGEEQLTAGVDVRGRWGSNGSVTCRTAALANGDLSCTLMRELKRAKTSIQFTVLGLTKSGYSYVAADNHDQADEDGSNGTRITVNRP
jgi:serine protease AprX